MTDLTPTTAATEFPPNRPDIHTLSECRGGGCQAVHIDSLGWPIDAESAAVGRLTRHKSGEWLCAHGRYYLCCDEPNCPYRNERVRNDQPATAAARQPWDGPYDWDADAEAWVCQAHGTADCRQSPMCEHYGRIKEQELRNGLTACDCFPHGPDEPCSCGGCWACGGRVVGCTCDIDWDCEHRRSP